MEAGLRVRVSNGRTSFERTFTRPPVMIGRDAGAAQCVIDDARISKLHTCLDIQDGWIRVRDVGSMNGTYVGGQRLAPNCWVRPGAVGEPVELTISGYQIIASLYDDAAEAPAPASLAELASEMPGYGSTGSVGLERPQASDAAIGTFEMRGPIVRLAPKFASAMSSMATFCDALTKELDAAPADSRPHVCYALVKAFTNLAEEPRARAVLLSYGWRTPSQPPPPVETSLGQAALAAMQELAGWYVGRERSLRTPAEVTSFKDKLRATLDEFLLGFPALVESMSRFEQQMAIQAEGAAPARSSPAELAASLLDWVGNSDRARQRLRASFAELMMHEVALLNGVMTGVKAILTELSPAQIEKAAEGSRHGLFGRTDPWTAYKRRHSDLADEENERFRLLFGPEFVEEYRQFTHEASGPDKH